MVYSEAYVEFSDITRKLSRGFRRPSLYEVMMYKKYIASLEPYRQRLACIPYSYENACLNARNFPKEYASLYDDMCQVRGDVFCLLMDNDIDVSEIMVTNFVQPTVDIYDLTMFLGYSELDYAMDLMNKSGLKLKNNKTLKAYERIRTAIRERRFYMFDKSLYTIRFQ